MDKYRANRNFDRTLLNDYVPLSQEDYLDKNKADDTQAMLNSILNLNLPELKTNSLDPKTNDFLSSITGLDMLRPPIKAEGPSQLFLPKIQTQTEEANNQDDVVSSLLKGSVSQKSKSSSSNPTQTPNQPQTSPTAPATPTKEIQDEDLQMREAMRNYNNQAGLNLFLRSLEDYGNVYSGGKIDEQKYKMMDELAKSGVNKLTAEREGIESNLKRGKLKSEAEMVKQSNDPNSDYSKAYREAARGILKVAGLNPNMVGEGLSATKIQSLLGPFKDIAEAKMRDETNRLRLSELSEAKAERAYAKELAKEEKMRDYETIYGQARTKEDAKNLKNAAELKKKFDSQINEMIELREKHGGGATFNREDVARGKQLSKDLLLSYKELAKLGVLSESDENILNTIIPPDPLSYDLIPGQDPIMGNLKKFKKDSNEDFAFRVQNRILKPSELGLEALQKEQGNISNRSNKQGTEFPKQVRKGNQIATVSNEQELKEAMEEGFN